MSSLNELQILNQKNALTNNLRYYLTTTSPSYTTLYQGLDILKRQYPDNFNDIERLRQNVQNYAMRTERLDPAFWIVNWSNARLLVDLNSIF
jgi:hypothetical protein